MNKYRVVVGPYRTARRFAERMGWDLDLVVIVTRAHQLATLDPAMIQSIVTVQAHALGQRIMTEIREQIDLMRTLWPVPTVNAA